MPMSKPQTSAKILEFRQLRPPEQSKPQLPEHPEFYDLRALEELKGLLQEESDDLLVVLSSVGQ
jgi:hypothetical protein